MKTNSNSPKKLSALAGLFALTAATALAQPAPAGPAPVAGPRGGGGRGARGAAAPQPNPLTIENLTTALTLTDVQVTTVKPLLDGIDKVQKDMTDKQTRATDLRSGLNSKLSDIFTPAQKNSVAVADLLGTYDDHKFMIAQLGITGSLRPGARGSAVNDPNYANYDETKAHSKSPVPPLLAMADGRPITTPAMWEQRRKELFEIFDRELYGRLPAAAKTIKVTWEVTGTTQGMSGNNPITTRQLVGHVDPTYYPAITVNIRASVTTPDNAAGKVPVIIVWGGGGGGSWAAQAIAQGWGYGGLDSASIQADTGGMALRQGIIGLINKGQPRKPDDWGALRAWAWGAGRLIDFFETDALVDAKQVAFEGHSRFGKATLAAVVYEPRVFTGFVSSSGEGGAKLWRHLVGEQVENLASWNTPTSEYHWMAGNFLKYAGPLTVEDLPVDNHQFVALIAPRPIFVSGGEYIEFNGAPGHPESRYSGESWQDTPGTFMATAGASPVWKLLGKKGLSNDALNLHFDVVPDPLAIRSQMPPPLTPLIDGDIAFRQHDKGHTDGPNWPTFMEFLGRHFKSPGLKQ